MIICSNFPLLCFWKTFRFLSPCWPNCATAPSTSTARSTCDDNALLLVWGAVAGAVASPCAPDLSWAGMLPLISRFCSLENGGGGGLFGCGDGGGPGAGDGGLSGGGGGDTAQQHEIEPRPSICPKATMCKESGSFPSSRRRNRYVTECGVSASCHTASLGSTDSI